MAIGQALVPPLNFVVDVIFRKYAFSTLQIVGSVVSVSAFLVVLIPVKSKKPTGPGPVFICVIFLRPFIYIWARLTHFKTTKKTQKSVMTR